MSKNSFPLSNKTFNKSDLELWVDHIAAHTEPEKIYWCNGSKEEYDSLCSYLVEKGTFIKLRRSDQTAMHASATPAMLPAWKTRLYLQPQKRRWGPTNNWMEPAKMKEILNDLMKGCMHGRTLYVIPFCMGPVGSPYSRYGAVDRF